MIRTSLLNLATATMLVLTPVALSSAQAQQTQSQQTQARTVELNQTLIDKWLVAMPAIVALGKSTSAPQTDDEARQQMDKICTEAGFQSADQCGEVTGYVGMIVSACDRRAQKFRDPIPLMRRELARLERDTTLPPDARDKTIAEVKEIIAAFPSGFPAEHIKLMNANRDRIFTVLIATQQ